MKCIYCGKELQPDDVYCPGCGKAVQIVPDYSMYDDDYLKEVLSEQNPKAEQPKNSPERKIEQKKKKIRIIAGVTATGLVLIFAILVFTAAIRTNHNNSFDYQVKCAREALLDGNPEKAIEYYKRAVELDSGSTQVQLALADIYMKQEDYASATPLYEKITRADKKNREAFKNLITIYEHEKNTDGIITLSRIADESLADLFADYQTDVPQFDLEEGTFDKPQSLRLSSSHGEAIYYTMDGSNPKTLGVLYTNPIELTENNREYTIKAVCLNDKKIYSETVTKRYKIQVPAPEMPAVLPDGGNFTTPTTVTVDVPEGCSAYYTWDGSAPGKESSLYSQPIEVPEGNNVLSVIIYDKSTGLTSEIYRGRFAYYAQEDGAENTAGDSSSSVNE